MIMEKQKMYFTRVYIIDWQIGIDWEVPGYTMDQIEHIKYRIKNAEFDMNHHELATRVKRYNDSTPVVDVNGLNYKAMRKPWRRMYNNIRHRQFHPGVFQFYTEDPFEVEERFSQIFPPEYDICQHATWRTYEEALECHELICSMQDEE
jgi:hypothetical protein